MALTGLWSRVQSAVFGLGVGGALSRAFRPVFELLEQEAWSEKPHQVLPPQQLAQLVATAITEFGPAAEQARRSGFNANKLAGLVQLALTTPTIGQAMDARRREAISDEQYRHVLRKAGIEPQYDEAMRALLRVLPPVTDLIRFAVREVFNAQQRDFLDLDAEYPEALTAAGAPLGLAPSTLRDYWAAHWELPSYEQLAEMHFRGELSLAEFEQGLKAIDYAPTWRGKLLTIARRIPTLPDMVRFAVREVWTPDVRRTFGLDDEYPERFTREAALHGLAEEHAQAYWAAHWELPSVEQGFRMRHRDVIDDRELNLLLRTKDVMPFWRERLRAITFLVPGRVDLRRMLRAEVLSEAEVEAGYQRLGYAPPEARLLRDFAVAERDGTDVGIAARRVYRRAVIARAYKEFMAWSLSEAEARAGLGRIGIPDRHTDELLPLWRAERDLVRTELTPAQIRAALRGADMSEQDALARLRERGYSEDDAALFLGITARELTPAAIAAAYARNALTFEEARLRLAELGYSEEQASVLLSERRPELSARDIRDALDAEVIDEETALARLVALGYTPEDASIFLASG